MRVALAAAAEALPLLPGSRPRRQSGADADARGRDGRAGRSVMTMMTGVVMAVVRPRRLVPHFEFSATVGGRRKRTIEFRSFRTNIYSVSNFETRGKEAFFVLLDAAACMQLATFYTSSLGP